jgi:hypothetical protein
MIREQVKQILRSTPESVQIALQAIALNHRRDYFMIGDLTNLIIDALPPDDQTDVMDVYIAVAIFLNGEYSARTVRHYSSLAAFYPVEVRDKYDLLPFSHFAFARSLGERWGEVLETSLALAMERDHPVSVDHLSHLFTTREAPPNFVDTESEAVAVDDDLMSSQLPAPVDSFLRFVIRMVSVDKRPRLFDLVKQILELIGMMQTEKVVDKSNVV